MFSRGPERTTRRTPDYRVHVVPNHRARVVGLVAVVAVIAAALGLQSPASLTSQAAATVEALGVGEAHPPHATREPGSGPGPGQSGSASAERLGLADGAIPDRTPVFADDVPGVAKLDGALLDALRRAATDAGGVRFAVNSGWRSPEYQAQLLRDAVATYGSEAEAARWVATPERSEHVSGDAVDIGPSKATAWLAAHGAAYGLCRIYGNEPWHFELRPDAVDHGCPAMYADPTHDPRLRP
jgi:D-alanyl-D-alanine carboxypeptidase